MDVTTLQIEAFNTNLHGSKILCQGPFQQEKYPPIIEAITHLRSPFKKKILLSSTTFSLSKYLPILYDAHFQIKDGQDWTPDLIICSSESGIAFQPDSNKYIPSLRESLIKDGFLIIIPT